MSAQLSEKDSILNARKIYYLLFSRLFMFSNNKNRFSNVVEILDQINQAPLNIQSQEASQSLILKFQNLDLIAQEFDDIFHTPPSPVRNTFSFYEEGYEAGRACARVRGLLAKTDIRRDESEFKENEDNVGFCFAFMFELISKALNGDEKADELSKELFTTIINPYIDEFIEAINSHKEANAYIDINVLLKSFIEFERICYEAPKPVVEKKIKEVDGISRSEALRREQNRARRKAEKNLQERKE
ncbi:molecular chaperone TorD family protein [Campylobacter mucosalis]|uniref:molecular chaperone TorD family protein n=1 Tax=Campylobacter mucosalis TaxID=202 RepID=UPI0014701D58